MEVVVTSGGIYNKKYTGSSPLLIDSGVENKGRVEFIF
jgi:hypothetical protein